MQLNDIDNHLLTMSSQINCLLRNLLFLPHLLESVLLSFSIVYLWYVLKHVNHILD